MTVNQSTPNRIPAAHPLLGQVGAAAGHYDELRALPGPAGAGESAGRLARAWQGFFDAMGDAGPAELGHRLYSLET